MKRLVGFCGAAAVIVGTLLAVATAQAPATSADSLPPIPQQIAARLPKFCRYDLDLSGFANPHALLASRSTEGDLACPFADGGASRVRVYSLTETDGCKPPRFRDLKMVETRQIGGREYRRASQCMGAATVDPSAAPGRTYQLTMNFAQASDRERFRFLSLEGSMDHKGAPWFPISRGSIWMAPGAKPGRGVICLQMLPGAGTDPLTFYRAVGQPLPAAVVQSDITGQSCPQPSNLDDGEDAFNLMLQPTAATPKGAAFAHQVRAILARDGITAARPSGRMTFALEWYLVSKTKDGGHMGIIGADGPTSVEMRQMTHGVCAALFDVASQTHLYIQAMQPEYLTLRPSKVRDLLAGSTFDEVIAVTDADDLCAILKPGFDEWRARSPAHPLDLSDRRSGPADTEIIITGTSRIP
jgi:hypothetical protein